jgi:Flp pilus assembly protein TadG
MRSADRQTADRGREGHRKWVRRRPGAAAAELALMLPILFFVAFVTVDYGRMNTTMTTITNCARNGALYASSTVNTQNPNYTLDQAVKADAYPTWLASSLSWSRNPTAGYLNDTNGNKYVEITVSCSFSTTITYPGVPGSTTLSRTVRMAVSPL